MGSQGATRGIYLSLCGARTNGLFLLLLLYAGVIMIQSMFPCAHVSFTCSKQDRPRTTIFTHRKKVESTWEFKYDRMAKEDRVSVAVCITGQKQRLELESKMRYLFNEPQIIFDVILVLSNQTATFTNNEYASTGAVDLSSVEYQIDRLIERARHVKYITDIQPTKPLLNPSFYWGFDKNETEAGKKFRAKNDVSQYLKLQKCYREVERFEAHIGRKYDALFRIRDDLFIFKKLPLLNILDGMKGKHVVGAECDSWYGINDKLAIVNRPAGSAYFEGPVQYQYFLPDKLNWTKIRNSETFLYNVLNTSNVTVELVGPDVLPLAPSLVANNKWKACLKLYHLSFQCLAAGHEDMKETLQNMRCPRVRPEKRVVRY